jgi:hypothetical protein
MLKRLEVYNNQINAIDEKLIDNSGLEWIDTRNNSCSSKEIADDSTNRDTMRAELRVCFENFENLMAGKVLLNFECKLYYRVEYLT